MESGNEKEMKSSFGKTGYKMLKNVILGKLTEHSVASMKMAIESGNYARLSESAESELQSAQRYQTTLDVLAEIEKEETHNLVSTKVV